MSRKNSFTKEDLINSSLGKLFGMDKGKLPMPPMLMIDRILHISDTGGKYGKGEIKAETRRYLKSVNILLIIIAVVGIILVLFL